MISKRKTPVLIAALALTAGGIGAAATVPAAASSGHTSARTAAKYHTPLVVRLRSNDKKVVISRDHFRPGVVQFHVTKTAKRSSSIVVLETDNLRRAFKLFGKAIQGGPGSADAMAKVDRITTFYSGEKAHGTWQVRLSRGSYFALDNKTNNLTPFKVRGDQRHRHMRQTPSTVTATKGNMWRNNGPLHGNWLTFDNNAREIHFLESQHVKQSTTNRDVRKALYSNKKPTFALPGGWFFEIESPGVKTVHKVDMGTGKHLLLCFMPSEEQDGVPHALMGMWKLVQVVD
jgi:hypothetical protein